MEIKASASEDRTHARGLTVAESVTTCDADIELVWIHRGN
jgi:hypothetical protein